MTAARALLVSAALLLLAGCGTATLTAGANLGRAGQAAAQQMQQNATVSSEALNAFRRAVAFNDGYNHAIGNAASQDTLAHLASIQASLGQYGKLLKSLADSYDALADLSAYDAAGTFNSSIQTLAADTEKLGGALGTPVAIPPDVTGGVGSLGGAGIGAVQARRVRAASNKLETVLVRIIALMDSPSTRVKLVPVQGKIAGVIDQASATLLANGLYSYDPLLDQLGSPMGLKTVDGADKIVAGSPSVRAGLQNVAAEQASEQVDQIRASYDASVAALKELVPLHDKLRKGEPLDLNQLAALTGRLQSIAASIENAAPSAAKGK